MALSAEEELVVREWAPLNHLFQKLPSKHQGFFSSDLKLTCMDAISELIVMGTNYGIIYCFNRKTHNMERLKCENVNSPITCIKVISTVDYMLAVGNKEGNVNIFQLPKAAPESLPVSLRPKDKQVERYTVSEMHKGYVTSLEWSKNGMKLFSGDSSGHVILTEIDFYMHLCKSSEILDEAYEIVQLNYLQQRLLVSTTYRSIICQKQDKWKVCQIGKKDRKLLGRFGGTIMQTGLGPSNLVLYCSRPGLRIWQADLNGSVEKTILFKDSLNDASPEVFLLNPVSPNLKCQHLSAKDPSFGIIHQYHEKYLVTYNSHTVYILSAKDMKIVGIVNHLRGVLDVAVHKDEIFILESDRSLIRISPYPEFLDVPVHSQTATTPLGTSLRELTNKLQSASIITAAPTKSAFPLKSTAIVTAEEATENRKVLHTPTTPITPTESSDPAYQTYRKLEIYNQIAEQDFDEVIQYTHRKKKKAKRKQSPTENVMTSSMCSFSSNSSDERDHQAFNIKPTLMNISTVGVLGDLKSPDSLQHDISTKENLLAELLNFDSFKVDLKKLESTESEEGTSSGKVIEEVKDEKIDLENHKDVTKTENLEDDTEELDIDSRPEVDQNEFSEAASSPEPPKKKINVAQMPACEILPDAWLIRNVTMDLPPMLPYTKQTIDEDLGDWEIV